MRNMVVVATFLVAASCGGSTRPPADDTNPHDIIAGIDQDEDDLWSRSFVSVAVTEEGEPRPLLPGTRITLAFEEREDRGVARWSACNFFGATVQITAERLLVGDDIEGTDMGCFDELHEQDMWLVGFFESDPQWALSEDRLTLSSGETTIEFERERG